MEMTPMQMYWLVKLDDIQGLIVGLIVLAGAAFFTGIVFRKDAGIYDGEKRCQMLTKSRKILKWSVVMFLSATVALTLLPSTKQMAAMMIVPKIANSEKVQTIGNKVYDLAVEWMEELKPAKEKETK